MFCTEQMCSLRIYSILICTKKHCIIHKHVTRHALFKKEEILEEKSSW